MCDSTLSSPYSLVPFPYFKLKYWIIESGSVEKFSELNQVILSETFCIHETDSCIIMKSDVNNIIASLENLVKGILSKGILSLGNERNLERT